MREITLTPENKEKITLFKTRGEAAVFWICCAAVLMLGVISLFRWGQLRMETEKYLSASNEVRLIQGEMKKLSETVSVQQNEISDLRRQVDSLIRKQ